MLGAVLAVSTACFPNVTVEPPVDEVTGNVGSLDASQACVIRAKFSRRFFKNLLLNRILHVVKFTLLI